MEPEKWEDMREFEEEFPPGSLHPLQALGAFVIVFGCLVTIIAWVILLLDTLRH